MLCDLSRLLTLSCGIRSVNEGESFRTYPSAGGRYPVEVYIAVFDSNELEKGLYHYNVRDDALEFIKSESYSEKVLEFYQNQTEIVKTKYPCAILLSMVFSRTMAKYSERGYRYILLDAGHLSQNLYLVATYLGMGIVEFGAGVESDDYLDDLLGLAQWESFFLGFALGYPL